jgi:hypothetical protein
VTHHQVSAFGMNAYREWAMHDLLPVIFQRFLAEVAFDLVGKIGSHSLDQELNIFFA